MKKQLENKKTVHQDSSKNRWTVLVSKNAFWKETAQMSIILFFLSFGMLIIGWSLWTGEPILSPIGIYQHYTRGGGGSDEPTQSQPVVAEVEHRAYLSGQPLDSEPDTNVYSVVIDNMVDARPHTGISQASLVIEFPVESTITRFLAFFTSDQELEKIGPVRSARPYIVRAAEEFGALFAHVGGSNAALKHLETEDTVRDVNQFFSGLTFWRDYDRYAPHNTYTSSERLLKADDKLHYGWEMTPVKEWLYEERTNALPEEGADIEIDFGSPAYKVIWSYDAERGDYTRYQGGERQKDGFASIRAVNIAVQFTEVNVLDYVGRKSIVTDGVGDALLIQEGRVHKAQWVKKEGDRTRFILEDGEEFVFRPGTTWIEVVSDDTEIDY